MRNVIFKHLTSPEAKKKDVLLKEVFEKDGVVARTERRCFYFIKDITHLDESSDLQKWLDSKSNGEPCNSRHFLVMKGHNDRLGEDKIVCKVAGTFYAIVDKCVFTIAFLYSFKVSFLKASLAK